jgi:hypothetical protein
VENQGAIYENKISGGFFHHTLPPEITAGWLFICLITSGSNKKTGNAGISGF